MADLNCLTGEQTPGLVVLQRAERQRGRTVWRTVALPVPRAHGLAQLDAVREARAQHRLLEAGQPDEQLLDAVSLF